ncbi:MAG: hypothetical protein O2964_08860, partial [Verrucomicrobia bacterium]|nr:hypothetical protein [Verrucomicrobiota bacterium]
LLAITLTWLELTAGLLMSPHLSKLLTPSGLRWRDSALDTIRKGHSFLLTVHIRYPQKAYRNQVLHQITSPP